jgi:hypothetical protein
MYLIPLCRRRGRWGLELRTAFGEMNEVHRDLDCGIDNKSSTTSERR